MEPERHEVYERIPWETLDKSGHDKQWLYIGLAGAVALGALAYSFMRNQPVDPVPEAQTVPSAAPVTTARPNMVSPTTVASPVVVAEADLYAVDPERLVDTAAAHAEWFAVEYFSVDGSDAALDTLSALLPSGVPLPEAPDGTQVFVDWVGTHRVTEVGPLSYEVDVVVRTLVSTAESGFVRQPVRMARIEVGMSGDGTPVVLGAPVLVDRPLPVPALAQLQDVPAEILERVADARAVVGGVPSPDGGWRVVAMIEGIDGVIRPVTVEVPGSG